MKKPLDTDHARAKFKKRAKELLAPLEKEYGIDISFGRLDQNNGWRMKGAQMKLRFEPTPPSPEVSIYEKDTTDNSNICDSPAAIALTDAMRKDRIRSDIRLFRKIDPANFIPRVVATYKGEELFNLSIEIWQDIKFGDWSGMFSRDGKPDPIRSNEYVENEITLMCIHEKPHFKEQIIEAFAMMRESIANQSS